MSLVADLRLYLDARVAGFSPLQFTPAWWIDAMDAATITQAAGSVSQINDKSGNNRHATQATGAFQPTINTRTINSRAALEFNGSSQRMNVPTSVIPNAECTVFSVHYPDTLPGAYRILSNQGTGGSLSRWYTNNQSTDNANSALTRGSPVSGQAIVQMNGYQGSNTQFLKCGNDAVTTGAIVKGAYDTTGCCLGSYGSGFTDYYDGLIGEVIVYHANLTNDQKTAVLEYLNSKWGVS